MTICTTASTDLTDLGDLFDLPGQRTTDRATSTTELAREHAVRRYGPVHGEELVADCFDAAVAAYRDARVTTFVPVLVERRLREVLREA